MVTTLYSKEEWYWDDIIHTGLSQSEGDTVSSELSGNLGYGVVWKSAVKKVMAILLTAAK